MKIKLQKTLYFLVSGEIAGIDSWYLQKQKEREAHTTVFFI